MLTGVAVAVALGALIPAAWKPWDPSISAALGLKGRAGRLPSQCRGPRSPGDGPQRWALVIGVGKYADPDIRDLPGPPSDARSMARVLQAGYGFPPENTCILLDEQATRKNLRAALQSHLLDRVRPRDAVVIYFAGHGSHVTDISGDEADGLDETWVLHDSFVDSGTEISDDEIHQWLSQLHARLAPDGGGANLTVILDSCHSGTATRGLDQDATRYYRSRDVDGATSHWRPLAKGEGASGLVADDLPGLITLAASHDSQPARESRGRGVFSAALVQALAEAAGQGLRYADIWPGVTQRVAKQSRQVPQLMGDADTPLFGDPSSTIQRPLTWEVTGISRSGFALRGPPLPGWSEDAIVRVYPPDALPVDLMDPGRAKGELLLTHTSGGRGEAQILSVDPKAGDIATGDVAVLSLPGDDVATLPFRFSMRPGEEVPDIWRDALRDAIQRDEGTRHLLQEEEEAGAWEIGQMPVSRQIFIRGPEGDIRIHAGDIACGCSVAEVQDRLAHFGRQQNLLELRGEGGDVLFNDHTLRLRLVAETGAPPPEPVGGAQSVHACLQSTYRIEVSRTPSSDSRPLHTGILALSNDGKISIDEIDLAPGETARVQGIGPIDFQGPFYVWDHIVAIGHLGDDAIPWRALGDTAAGASKSLGQGLTRVLDTYLSRGWKTVAPGGVTRQATLWTTSQLHVLTEPNPAFAGPGQALRPPRTASSVRLEDFSLTPYLAPGVPAPIALVLEAAAAHGGRGVSLEAEGGSRPVKTLLDGVMPPAAIPACTSSSMRAGTVVVDTLEGIGEVWTLIVDPELAIGWGPVPNPNTRDAWLGFHELLDAGAWAELSLTSSDGPRCIEDAAPGWEDTPVLRRSYCDERRRSDATACRLGAPRCAPLALIRPP